MNSRYVCDVRNIHNILGKRGGVEDAGDMGTDDEAYQDAGIASSARTEVGHVHFLSSKQRRTGSSCLPVTLEAINEEEEGHVDLLR